MFSGIDQPFKYLLTYKFSQDHIELLFSCIRAKGGWNNNPNYHSLYSILDFDWLIHLQITACKYRSAANNWCKCTLKMLRQPHAHFENASSASIKKFFFQNVNMARFAELSESELTTILEEKDAENTKKATKVTLNIFRGYLQEKGLREAELLT